VASIADAHDGEVVRNPGGGGADVWFSLPEA
jgi:hypothetical protein